MVALEEQMVEIVEEMEVKVEDLLEDNLDNLQIKEVDPEEDSLNTKGDNLAKEIEDLAAQKDKPGPEVKLMEAYNNKLMVLDKEEILEVKIKTREVNHQEEQEQQEEGEDQLQEAEEDKEDLAEDHNQDTWLQDLLELVLDQDLGNLVMEEEAVVEIMMK